MRINLVEGKLSSIFFMGMRVTTGLVVLFK